MLAAWGVCAPVAQYVRNVIARLAAGNDASESREAALARGHLNYSAAETASSSVTLPPAWRIFSAAAWLNL